MNDHNRRQTFGVDSLYGIGEQFAPPARLACVNCPSSKWTLYSKTEEEKVGRLKFFVDLFLFCHCLINGDQTWEADKKTIITQCTSKNFALAELERERRYREDNDRS